MERLRCRAGSVEYDASVPAPAFEEAPAMRSYGQFCSVAKAAEIFAERWTPLIVRELVMGCHRFNELEAGLPRISRSLLTQRLRALEAAGLVERRTGARGRGAEYHLTQAGKELGDVVVRLGEWGQRWVNAELEPGDLDPALLMWDLHRRINLDRLPERRVVARFDFTGAHRGTFWLVLERPEPSVCLKDPGFEVDLCVTADTLAFHQVWVGHLSLTEALRRVLIELDGPRALTRAFPGWLALSVFAGIERAALPTAAGRDGSVAA
jgi:DNA-binding HxlR family transcriptional regulator